MTAGQTFVPILLAAGQAALSAPTPTTTQEPAHAPTVAAHGTPLLVLYGSNLGTAEHLAHLIGDEGASRGFSTTVDPLDDHTGKLPKSGGVIVITSSYNGTPPDNAAQFCGWLRSRTIRTDQLKGVRYSVFGCGDHDWTTTFQAIPRLIDGQMEACGAQRVYPRGEGDAQGDFDGQFQAWYAGLWPALAHALDVDLGAAETTSPTPLYTAELVAALRDQSLRHRLRREAGDGPREPEAPGAG